MCRARKRERDSIRDSPAGPTGEDLVAVEHLDDVGVDHGRDDQDSGRVVRAVAELVRAARSDRTRNDLSDLESSMAVRGPQRWTAGEHDDQFLVGVMGV